MTVTRLSRLAVVGASGRMGRAVVRLATEAGISVVAAIGASDIGRDAGELAGLSQLGVAISADLEEIVRARAACVVDFSSPQLLPRILEATANASAALVSGTTGFGDKEARALDEAAKRSAVLWEPNMSVGIHVLSALVAQAVAMLGADFDIEIVEAHHKHKVDAPSGTAMRLAEVAKRARDATEGVDASTPRDAANDAQASTFVYGREGKPGPRAPREIGVLALRGGDVIGDHTVHLLAAGERLELTHRASNRDLFAAGALRAAVFLAGKKPGRYTLTDVLGTPA